MSLQTNVFENGRWVTRNIDPYQARARNTEPQRKEKTALLSSSSLSLAKTPSFGLVTRTLVGSSVIKWIIPARIRYETKNDVLFITADAVAIKEAFGDYTLKDIAIKNDFDAPIRSARILGDPRELADPDKFADQERLRERNGMICDFWEYHDNENLQRPLRVIQGFAPEIPPHIAVLALESNKLVFFCAVSGASDQPQFICCQKELPAAQSPLEKLGEHIAVDPKSRAIAVAAQEGIVYVYALHSMSNMRQALAEDAEFKPIKEERCLPNVPTGASILKMEFLYPSQNDPGQIILLLIVSQNGKTRLLWYEWNSGMSLHRSQLRARAQSLPQDELLPLLLIPLKHFTAFMVVCERRITLYKDLLTGTPSRYVQRLDQLKDPEEQGISGSRPVWVQWARPMRKLTETFTANHDGIFLCRQDGVVQYLTILNIEHMLDSTHKAGRLGINVDTAFAILDVGPTKVDLFVAGGDMSEGGLWRSGPRVDPTLLATIPNWTPLNSLATINASAEFSGTVGSIATEGNPLMGQQRMFACTGRGRHGAITDLRYGYAAQKALRTHDLSDEVNRDVLNIWAFHHFFEEADQQQEYRERLKDHTYVLISCPMRTFLLHMPLEGRPRVVNVDLGLEYNARTIAACSTTRGFVQVSENSIRITILPVPPLLHEQAEEQGHYQAQAQEQAIMVEDEENIKAEDKDHANEASYCYNFADSRVVAGSIYANADTPLILLAILQAEEFYLQLGELADEYVPLKTIPLQSQPSKILLKNVGDDLLAFVSNLESELLVVSTDPSGSRLDLSMTYKFPGSYAICDSLVVTTSSNKEGEQPTHLLVCGLRNGTIRTLYLGARHIPVFLEELNIGHTSVTVLSDTTQKTRVIVHCEEILCTLEYHNGVRCPASIHRILLTDTEDPEFQHGSLSAITQAVDSWLPRNVPGFTAGSLFCVDGNQLHTVSIEQSLRPEMVPRRLPIGGTPSRVIYSTHLQKLIVLYNEVPVYRTTKRMFFSRIAFCDPDKKAASRSEPDAFDVEPDTTPDENVHNDVLMAAERRPGERFLGVTEWFPLVDGNQYHMLVLNTMFARAEKRLSRLLFLAISQDGGSCPKLIIKKRLQVEGHVYSVAVYPDEKSLVYCSGNELCIQTLDSGPSGIKWQLPVKAAMRSPARHITIVEPLIYVSSGRESLIVYRYEDGKLTYQYGDQSARNGLHHIHIPQHSLFLASDMNNTVVGLWEPPERRIDNAMSTVFEAALPSSVTNLKRIAKPAWYHPTSPESSNETVIGTSADGTIRQFDILTSGWKVLRFIQNMAERNPLICPFAGKRPFKRHLEPSTATPHFMHINGDILQRVLERGGEGCIRGMLNVEPDLESHTDFDSVEERWGRFRELAGELVDVSDEGWLGRLARVIERRMRGVL